MKETKDAYILYIYEKQSAKPYIHKYFNKERGLADLYEFAKIFKYDNDGYAELHCQLEDNLKCVYTVGIKPDTKEY